MSCSNQRVDRLQPGGLPKRLPCSPGCLSLAVLSMWNSSWLPSSSSPGRGVHCKKQLNGFQNVIGLFPPPQPSSYRQQLHWEIWGTDNNQSLQVKSGGVLLHGAPQNPSWHHVDASVLKDEVSLRSVAQGLSDPIALQPSLLGMG